MTLRLLEIYHPADTNTNLSELLQDIEIIDLKQEKKSKNEVLSRLLISAEKTDAVLEILENTYATSEQYRVIILSAEAVLPRPDTVDKDHNETSEIKQQKDKERISTEEIYEDVSGGVSKFSKTYFILLVLAAVVAAIGILYNNVAVVIGSMVIAPLLKPSMALSLGITLADSTVIRRAIGISFLGFVLAFCIGIFFGLLFVVDPSAPEIFSRTDLNLMYVLLAFSGGIAGSVSISRGVSEALVGVMVAVALLPPLVTSGLLLGSSYFMGAVGAFLLFLVNLVCINLAGVITFMLQGVNPRKWWEKKKAKKMVWKALFLWVLLLSALIVLILLYQYVV